MSTSSQPPVRARAVLALSGVLAFGCGAALAQAAEAQPPLPEPQAPPSAAPPDAPISTAPRQPLRTVDNYAAEISSQVLTSTLPVVFDGRESDPVVAQVTLTRLIAISPSSLEQSLGAALSETVRAQLQGLGPDLAPPETLAPLGIQATLDSETLSIAVALAPLARAPTEVSLTTGYDLTDAVLIEPGRISAGLTFAAAVTDTADDARTPSYQIPFDGFINLGGIKGVTAVFGGSTSLDEDGGTERAPLVIFRDDPDQALRVSVGDLATESTELSAGAGFLGLQIARSYELLQPNRNIRPTGQRSFFLERRSTVEVTSNGRPITRFVANPGPVNLDDIPLADLSNDVSIVVEDDLGRREIDNFSLVTDLSLLRPGITEYSISLGVLEDATQRLRYNDAVVGSGAFRRGISDSVTVAANGAATEELLVFGASAGSAAPRGVVFAEAVFSHGDRSTGYGANVAYNGGPFFGASATDSLSVRFQYLSEEFATLGDPTSAANLEWSLGADYRMDLWQGLAGSIGANYAQQYGSPDASYGAFIGLSFRLAAVNVGLTGRYFRDLDGRDHRGAFVTLSRPIGRAALASASYDTLNRTSRAEISRPRRQSNPDLNYRLGAVQTPERTSLNGSLGVSTARAEAEAAIFQTFTPGGARQAEVRTARLQSGIGFADGTFGVGANAGQGFYLFRRHPTLKDAKVQVFSNAGSQRLSQSGVFGPAVARTLAPYRPETLQVRIPNAPEGYDLGPGRYVMLPGARTGSSVIVGAENFRSALATLKFQDVPVGLVYGTYKKQGSAASETFFTNRSGRALFSKLSPGTYLAEIPSLGVQFSFTVRDDDEAQIDLGVIIMERK